MGRRSKGFNSPFHGMKTPVRPAPSPEPEPTPRNDVGVDDEELFARAMSGVEPLAEHDRIEPDKQTVPPVVNDDDLALAELESLVRGEGSFSLDDSDDITSGRAPGVNRDALRRLRRGEFSFRRHLDLHGHNREDAHLELGRFIARARRDGERCVLIITGHGQHSPDGVAVLKDALPRWLSRAPIRAHVLAFCTARRVDGGPGAFYILLRRAGIRPYGAES